MGLKQLYEELGKIKDGVEKSVQTSETLKPLKDKQDTITKEIGEIKESKYYKRHDEYANSFHIYGSYYADFKKFLETVKSRKFEERVWNTEFAEPFFEIGKEKLAEEKKNGL